MASVFASILAMYQYDPTIFDDIHLPPELDAELLTDNIMLELAELGLIYADPEYMKFAIERWSAKDFDKWQSLYDTTVLDYDPIENYNRTETVTDINTKVIDGTDLETRALTGSNNEVRDLNGSIIDSGDDVTSREVNGFNAAASVESEKDTLTHGMSRTTEDGGTINRSLTDSGTVTTKVDKTDTDTHTTSANMKGNIGVTTSQQMIQQERDILEFNIYDYITDSFKEQFCVRVW